MGQEQTLFTNCRQERVGGSLGISVDVPGRLPPKDRSAETGIHLNMYLVSRKATAMLGGTPEEVPNLGDEAFFGAMSILYVRKGDTMITITPPNLQLVAATAAYGKVADAKSGPEQAKAMEDFMSIEKTDPTAAGLNKPDAMQGALATIAASSKKQGTASETQARSMAMALAAKVLAKL